MFTNYEDAANLARPQGYLDGGSGLPPPNYNIAQGADILNSLIQNDGSGSSYRDMALTAPAFRAYPYMPQVMLAPPQAPSYLPPQNPAVSQMSYMPTQEGVTQFIAHPIGTVVSAIQNAVNPSYKPPNYNTPQGVDVLQAMIRNHESGGNYQAKNPTTSASGAYQYVNGTWNNYGGYPEARLAPKAVQDARAREDIQASLNRYGGDPYKVLANHYLPVQADNPALWTQGSVFRHKSGKVTQLPPVASYVQTFVKGSPLEGQFKNYVSQQGQANAG